MVTRSRLIILGLLVLGGIAIAIALHSGGSTSSTKSSSASSSRSVSSVGSSGASGLPALNGVSSSADSKGSVAAQSAQPAAPPNVQGSTANAALPDILGRKIVQNSDIDVRAKEVPRAFQDIVGAVTAAGGFVASSSLSNAGDSQIADLTVRVPTDQYQSVLAKIRGMGTVDTEKSDANDATQEYTDLQARLRTLQATHQRYLDLLAQAANVTDILTLQDRIDNVQGQIEQVLGRISLLDHLTELATITVHLRPLGAVGQASSGGEAHPLEAAQSAWEHSLGAVRAVVSAVLVVIVSSWWRIPPLAALAIAARWWMGRRPNPALPTA